MAGLHLPTPLTRYITLIICINLLFYATTGIPFTAASGRNSVSARQQGNGQSENGRRIAPLPPRTGPPAANLPNLDEIKQRQNEAPRAALLAPSTMRSRHKPLEPRNGRRVGDPLPPIVRPSPTPHATPTALPTPSALPAPNGLPTPVTLPAPPHELVELEYLSNFLDYNSLARFLVDPSLTVGRLRRNSFEPLSDSPFSLWTFTESETSFDVAAPPMPQASGSKIVFTSSRDGFRQIYVMNSDGTGQARLTTDGSNNDNPRWSPNGAKILFQSDRDNPGSGLYDIYVMNTDGSGQARLTTDANDDCAAAWSPDGTKIVFQSLRNGVFYQIYTMNPDGSGAVNISSTGANETQPSWSPDGAKIAFASDRDQVGFPSVYLMNSNGSSQTRLTFSGTGLRDEQPAWSPNATKIAFSSTRDSTTESWTETDDCEIPEDDGQTFSKSRLHVNKEVYVMNANGSAQTRLTTALENDDSPCWTTDGTKIVFRSERERDAFDPTAQIWTMNADGTNQTNLSNSGNGDSSPSWTNGVANQSPVANTGGPYNGILGQNVSFNGSGSFDPDGTVTNYSWSFGDGGTGSGATPTHAYSATGTYNVTLTATDNLGAQGTASTTITISSSSSDQYVTNFLQLGVGRAPNGDESSYWTDILRAAYPQGQNSMLLAMRELGMTVFESAEYASRNRSDHWYVYDLYKTYLMREPDAQGWAGWEAAVPLYGRDHVRRAFDECGEFANIVATLTASGSPSAAVTSLATAQVDPFNQSGDQLQARGAEWGVSLLSLPGRAGLDLGLGLSYSSLVWTRSGPYLYFDQDNESLSPGLTIGFPTIQLRKFDAQTSRNVYILTAGGHHTTLRQIGTSNVYEAADSSYLQLTDYGGSLLLRTTDGTQMSFAAYVNNWGVTGIKDRNGNFITINNDWRGDIQNVTDTLGRVITFNYDTNANLSSITQTWNGATHTWATFGWDNLTMQPTLTNVVSTFSGETIPVLKTVSFDDGTYTKFLYNGNGQVTRMTQYASDSNPATDSHPRNYTAFYYDSATTDCPRLTATRTWAENWTGINGVPNEVTTTFGVEGDTHVLTAPDGTVYKEIYAGSADAVWMRGLQKQSEVWSGGVRQKITTAQWTQDNTSVSYKTNPRVYQTEISDGANNRRTTISYTTFTLPTSGTSCSLPADVYEYDANLTTVLRRQHTDYNLDANYLNRMIVGLPQAKTLYDGSNNLMAKTTYLYDWNGEYLQNPDQVGTAPTQHDGSYTTDFFLGRGNVVDVLRWDVNDPTNASKALESKVGYDIDGSVIFTRDALNHQTTISYNDSFSANGVNPDAPRSFSTFAYPTTLTDADGFSSTVRYHYDFGAKTRVAGPPPQNQPNGAIQTFSYDGAARLLQVTTANTGAYTRYVYGPYYVQTFSSVNNVADDLYSCQIFDGAGRVIAASGNHPGSTGGYKGQLTVYDQMGRAVKQTNPTEITGTWVPVGDDAAYQYNWPTEYDWKGRATKTYNMDGSYKEVSYTGCGCAGGEVVTLTDEVGRRQKVYSDVLGRQWKTEVLNWDGSVYATTTNTLNARDQVTLTRQWAGAENSSGAYQDTTMTFDGYGRLKTKHSPEQQPDPYNSASTDHTTWNYNTDDSVQSVIDARGASVSYVYNPRHLVTHIGYSAPTVNAPASPIPAPPAVDFAYDAAGNRLWMNEDGQRRMTYHYNSLSQIDWEDRQFPGLSGTFRLSYEYNLAGQVKKVSDETAGTNFATSFDSIGRPSAVNTVGYNGSTEQFASQIQYRAFGAAKGLAYGNNTSVSIGYNVRGQMANYSLNGVMYAGTPMPTIAAAYQYHADGRVKFVQDQMGANSSRDRAYKYDNVDRLNEAYSGLEARNFVNNTSGGTGDSPYHMTYGFDAWGNTLSTGGRYWSREDNTTETFNQFNRNPNWTYDAEANVISRPADADWITPAVNTFDAAGRKTSVTQSSSCWIMPQGLSRNTTNTNTQTFDGDGQVVKYSRLEIFNGTPGTEQPTYYLRSTVLGGRVISEYNYYNGQSFWAKTYVYAGGERIGSLGVSGSSFFNHYRFADPVTGDEILTMKNSSFSGALNSWTTLDTNGVDIPLADPFPPGGQGSNDCEIWDNSGADGSGGGKEANLYPTTDGGAKCIVDGVSMDCSFVSSEAVQRCPNNDCGPRWNPDVNNGHGSYGAWEYFHAFGNGYTGWLTSYGLSHYEGGSSFYRSAFEDYMEFKSHLEGAFSFAPPTRSGEPQYYWLQTPPAQRPGVTPLDVKDLGKHINELLAKPSCSNFLSSLIATAATAANPAHSTDVSKLFDMIAGGTGGYFLENRAGGGTIGGYISQGNASVYLSFGRGWPNWSTMESSAQALAIKLDQYGYAIRAIHETAHHAGKYYFSDQELAIAAKSITGIRTNFPSAGETNVNAWGRYWNDILRDRCPPVRK